VRAAWVQVARGCARVDSRPDTAKIGSADRVDARLLAVVGVRTTFPHGLGPKRIVVIGSATTETLQTLFIRQQARRN
jgi:hypothetical protein